MMLDLKKIISSTFLSWENQKFEEGCKYILMPGNNVAVIFLQNMTLNDIYA